MSLNFRSKGLFGTFDPIGIDLSGIDILHLELFEINVW